jgi:metal-dependent HD superfamily phosphatase/phosphodiesterase
LVITASFCTVFIFLWKCQAAPKGLGLVKAADSTDMTEERGCMRYQIGTFIDFSPMFMEKVEIANGK